MLRLADWLTRLGDRILFGPPAPPPRQWTPQRYSRLVREGAVVDVDRGVPATNDPTLVDRAFPGDVA